MIRIYLDWVTESLDQAVIFTTWDLKFLAFSNPTCDNFISKGKLKSVVLVPKGSSEGTGVYNRSSSDEDITNKFL